MNDKPGAEIDFKIAEISRDIVSMVESSDHLAHDVERAKAEIAALHAQLVRAKIALVFIAVLGLIWPLVAWKLL